MGYMYFKSKRFDDKRGWCGRSADTDAVYWQNQPSGFSDAHPTAHPVPFHRVSMCPMFRPWVNEDASAFEHLNQPPSALINGSLEEDGPSPQPAFSNPLSAALT